MSELARHLAEAAERLFAQRCGTDVVASASAGTWPQALWSELEALTPAQLLVPEERGGAGGDWSDACALLERAGESNLPLPVAETVLAGWLGIENKAREKALEALENKGPPDKGGPGAKMP